MKIIFKIVLSLLSLAALVIALWTAVLMFGSRENSASLWLIVSGIAAAAMLIFAVVINPFVAARLFPKPAVRISVSIFTLAFTLIAWIEGTNYLAWSDVHRQANEITRASYGNIEVDNHHNAHSVGHALVITANSVTTGAAAHELSSNELKFIADIRPIDFGRPVSAKPSVLDNMPQLSFDVIEDGKLSSRAEFKTFAFALVRSKVLAANGQDDASLATTYLEGGQIVVRGTQFHQQFPICAKDAKYIRSATSAKSPYVPMSVHTQLANANCTDITAKYSNDTIGRPPLPSNDLLTKFGREETAFVDILARDGTLLLTASFPLNRLKEAETAANITAGKMARGEMESSFSPFTNYTDRVSVF